MSKTQRSSVLVSMALRLADRAYLFEAGEIVLSGTGEELQSHPEVAKAYLGH